MKSGFIIFFLTVLWQEKELSATITQGPSNAVAENGDTVKLNCVATDLISYWYLSKNGTVADEVALAGPGCSIRSAYVDHYAVESLGGGTTCNLIIFNITMAQAGVYRCFEAPNEFLSILTVIDESPTMTSNTTLSSGLHVAVENETVINTCTLNYDGSVSPASTLQPHFYWTDSNGQNKSSYNDSTTEDTAFTQLTVTAGRKNITSYICHVYFQLTPPTMPNYASNIPTVSKSASSPVIEVLYSPGNTNITSTISTMDKCVYRPESLTCTADANPPAEYSWKDLSNSVTSNGSTTNIASGGEYECSAYNQINGKTYADTKVANEATCQKPDNLTISGPSCSDNVCVCYENQTMIKISCFAAGFPIPTVHWRSDVPDHEDLGSLETIDAEFDGNYSCTAKNTFGNKSHSETVYFQVYSCQRGCHLIWLLFLIYPVVGWILGGIFAIYYGKTGKKSAYNTHFPFLKKMLPCMNTKTNATAFARCGWIILYILMATVVFIIPIMFIKVQCCKTKNAEGQNANTHGNEGEHQHPNDNNEHITQTFSAIYETDKL